MSVTAICPLTRHDYEALPETGKRYQLIGGELRVAPAPNRYHQEVSKNLEFVLHPFVKSNGLGKVYNAPFDVYLSDYDVFQPDLLFVSNERRSILTDKGAEGAPDLVIEILSPSTEHNDRNTKFSTYAQAGVTEYWLIDPDARAIELYRFQESVDTPAQTAILGENKTFGTPLLPGLEISIEEVFSDD